MPVLAGIVKWGALVTVQTVNFGHVPKQKVNAADFASACSEMQSLLPRVRVLGD